MKKGKPVDLHVIDPQNYRISYPYLMAIIEELVDEGYLKGVKFNDSKIGKTPVGLERMKITIKGIEYLQENTMMQKGFANHKRN